MFLEMFCNNLIDIAKDPFPVALTYSKEVAANICICRGAGILVKFVNGVNGALS